MKSLGYPYNESPLVVLRTEMLFQNLDIVLFYETMDWGKDVTMKNEDSLYEETALLCLSLPKISREDFELIFSELDDSGDFKTPLTNKVHQSAFLTINLDEFTDLCNTIALRFQKEPSLSILLPFASIREVEVLRAQ
ncbi:mitochondrial thiamine pyrophosphate transporter [Asimina triloba]